MSDSVFVSALLASVGDDPFKTWDSRLTWLSNGFAISLKGDRPTGKFLSVVDVRNSIVHGDGKLTSMQVGKVSQFVNLRRELSDLAIEISATRLIFSQESSTLAIIACREFVCHLDEMALKAYPVLRAASM
ncbi:hypothetical protein [Streptosporangium sandarakinum]|uniref:hypothetical protein n=1 Tax=Streptosporangium sandarakinum TaxID=1260955 RepID=UPI003711E4C0